MQRPTTTPAALPADRREARSVIWRLVEPTTPETAGIPLTSTRAHQLLKRGISSQTLGPLSEFLGLGKGVVAEYLDLDRSTANRRATKGQLLLVLRCQWAGAWPPPCLWSTLGRLSASPCRPCVYQILTRLAGSR